MADAAQMIEVVAGWNWPDHTIVHVTMRKAGRHILPATAYGVTIPVDPAGPEPAIGRRINGHSAGKELLYRQDFRAKIALQAPARLCIPA